MHYIVTAQDKFKAQTDESFFEHSIDALRSTITRRRLEHNLKRRLADRR